MNRSAGEALPPIPWFWFILVGAACTVLGIIGAVNLGMTYALTYYSVLFFGVLLMIAGFTQIFGAVFVRPWYGAVLQVLCGVLYLAAGAFAVTNEHLAASVFTLFLAISLIVGGAIRMLLAFLHGRVLSWILLALGGFIAMWVGAYVLMRWPWDSNWVIGLFFAIDLIFMGISWLAMGVNLRALDRAMRSGIPVDIVERGPE